MYVSRLRLSNFRNYESLELAFDRESVFFLGENAQGKTNLLESVFLCAAGRSHRTKREKELIRIGQSACAVKTLIKRREGPQTIDFRLYGDKPRTVYVNGIKTRKIGELMGHFNCVLFAPEDLNLVKSGPSERRRFLDMEISQTRVTYFYALQRYQRALKQRNALLKSAGNSAALSATLNAWDAILAENGAYILKTRFDYVGMLAAFAASRYHTICSGREEFYLSYESSLPKECVDKAAYQDALFKARSGDLLRKTTNFGIHRDDLKLALGENDLRIYGSQGQQRSAAIAMKLSELELMRSQIGQWPVLLMDDVLSELDESRQKQLLASIGPVQCFFTGTQVDGLKGRKIRIIRIANGRTV